MLGENGKAIYSELGEMMFTHFGVTGPLVLSASAHMPEAGRRPYAMEIDLKPALDEKKLDARILRDFEKYHNRDFQNALYDLAGRSMIPVLVRRSGIDPAQYSGFAFGVGLERIALLKYEIDDMRLLYENDARFLEQF